MHAYKNSEIQLKGAIDTIHDLCIQMMMDIQALIHFTILEERRSAVVQEEQEEKRGWKEPQTKG
jgi:hypothetical protein